MFGSKVQQEELGLLRLQKEVTRDRLRLQQRLGLIDGDHQVEGAPTDRASGRLYQVFVAMGEA